MKNIFSFKLYQQGLRKVRSVGIAMAIVIIALNALIPIVCMIDAAMWSEPFMAGHSVSLVKAPVFAPFSVAVILFAPLLIYSMFSFLNDRRSSDFYHAIPHKRACVYLSFLAAAMTWIIGVLLASSLVNSILWGISVWDDMNFAAFGLSFAAYAVIALVMAGFMALAMMLTGTVISNCLVFLLVLLFVRAIGCFFLYCLSDIAPMFVVETSWLRIFDLRFFIPYEILLEGIFEMDEAGFRQAGMTVYWLIVGILLLVGAGVRYVRRRSESATKCAPNKILQHIYRIAVTLPFMLLGIVFVVMEGSWEAYHFIFFVIAVLVYAIYELLTTKKIKNLVRSLPLLLVPVALSLIFVGADHGTKTIINATVPTEDKIAGVALMGTQYSTSYENTVTYGVFVDDEDVIRDTAAALQESKEWKSGSFGSGSITYYDGNQIIHYQTPTVLIKLKSGRVVAYNLRTTYDISAGVMNSEECLNAYISLPSEEEIQDLYLSSYGYGVDDGTTLTLWQSFLSEYDALTASQKRAYKTEQHYFGDEYFSFILSGVTDGKRFSSNYGVSMKYLPKTAMLYLELCNEKNDPVKMLTSLSEALTDENCKLLSGSFAFERMDNLHGSMDFYYDRDVLAALNAITIDSHLTDFEREGQICRVRLDYYVGYGDYIENKEAYYKENGVYATFFINLTADEYAALYEIYKGGKG